MSYTNRKFTWDLDALKRYNRKYSAIYDVSANNDGATFASLSALLSDANLDTLIPEEVRKGGMTIRFVCSSDNKYVQYRLMADEFTTDTTQWAIAEEGVYVENPEFVYVKTDKDDKILWAIKNDGGIYYGAGVPSQVVNYINEKIAELSLDEYEDIVAFLSDYLDSDTTLKVMIEDINAQIESLDATKVDKEEGKSLIDSEYASTKSSVENPEFLEVTTDSEGKILQSRNPEGVNKEYVGIETPSLKVNNVDITDNIDAIDTMSVINDSEGRIQIITDSEEKVVSYRDKQGILHEESGIKANSLSLSDKGLKDFKRSLKIESVQQTDTYVDKYYGHTVSIFNGNLLNLTKYKELTSYTNNSQASCLYENTLIVCDASEDWSIYDFFTGEEFAKLSKPIEGHFNSAVFANELHSGNPNFPYLYVSSWNQHGANGIYVFDLSLTNGQYSLNVVQVIDFSQVSDNIVGVGRNDFAIDFEKNILYYIGYLADSDSDSTNNAYTFAKMSLPIVSNGTISVQDTDIIESWRSPFYAARQASLYVDGKIFILTGLPNSNNKNLIIADVNTKSYENTIQLDAALSSAEEPEGLLLRQGDLLMTTQVGKVYKVAFENHDKEGIEKIGDGVLDGNVCIDYYNPYSDLDMENMLKLKGNLHGHTTYSDSEITPENYMIKYREAGYDFAAITDHDNYENGHLVPEYSDHIAPDPGVEGIIYMGPCYEDTAGTQHINVFQIPEFLGFKSSRTANEVFRKGSLEKGRLCCLNHPNWGSQFLSNDYILKMEKIFNFVELWNGSIGTTESSTEKGNSWAGACRAWDILLSSGHKVFGLAVDDYHLLPNHSENLMFRRGYVEVYSKGRTARDVYRALAQGRFVACNALGTDNTIEITAIDCNDGKYHIELAEACDIYFFGVNGSVLQENLSATSATYTLDGTEKYVRCAIKKNLEYKWLQPLIRKSTKRTFNL